MNKKILAAAVITIIICIIIALLLQKKENNNNQEYSDFEVETSGNTMTEEEAAEYQQDMESKQQAYYSTTDYSIDLSDYSLCEEMDDSFSSTAGDIYSYTNHSKLVTALSEKYSVEPSLIILEDIEYNEENMTYASVIKVGEIEVKAYFNEEVAYIEE